MKKNKMKYLFLLAVTLIFAGIAGAGTALSAVGINVQKEGHLLLDYRYGDAGIQDVDFSIYRVADVAEDSRLTLSGSFKEYPVRIEDLDDSGWKSAASTLATYVRVDSIEPDLVLKTDEQGKIDFGAFRTGLYLITGQDKTTGKQTFHVSPFLVSLPSLMENDDWSYDVLVRPKCSVSTEPTSPGGSSGGGSGKSSLTVIKVWNDDGFKELRPESIEVSLMRDGEVYRTVTLNSSNYWRYTWSGLGSEYSWDIVEQDVSEYYTVAYDEDDTKYTITNSILEEIQDGEVPAGLITIPDEAVPLKQLPKTGLLQWPVPLLAAMGLIFFALGWKDYIGKQKEKDEA